MTRYARQLPEIGEAGQRRLLSARVLCVGAGGLGCASLPYLAGAGVGRITVIDDDRVERGNLHRQVLFADEDVGRSKAIAAATRLRALNPDIAVEAMDARLHAGNVEALLRDHDIVLDGSDNYATKYLLNDACVKLGRPLVYASATGMEAMLTVFASADGPCLRCLFPQPPGGWVPNCNTAGVLGPLVGMAGAMQALEAVKLLAGTGEALVGRLCTIDARDLRVRRLTVARRANCPCCSSPADIVLGGDAVPEISAHEAAALPDAIYIDVREADEYAVDHIPGALHLPLSKLRAGHSAVLPRTGHIIIYCATGARARTAAPLLGIPCHCLRGGFAAWQEISHKEKQP